jgi:arginyl-tRNA synthetase
MMAEEGEISKNEQKKLAKKAEKAAKKQAAASGSNPAIATTTTTTAATLKEDVVASLAPVASAKKSTQNVWKLVNSDPQSTSAIKAVWTAREFGVELHAGTKLLPRSNSMILPRQPALFLNDEQLFITGGGNGMAQALARPPMEYLDQIQVDEWCEWERTVLRSNDVTHGLQQLQEYFTSPASKSPSHLVGHGTVTVADICVATTLFRLLLSSSSSVAMESFPAVQIFLNSHKDAFDAAVEYTQQLSQTSTVNVDAILEKECRLLKIVDTLFRDTIFELFGPDIELPEHIVKNCQNPKHGDYQLSAAMPIFAAISSSSSSASKASSPYKSPQQVAQAIAAEIGTEHPILMDLQMQGPGFVICKLREQFLAAHLQKYAISSRSQSQQDDSVPVPMMFRKTDSPQVCVVDFSSPNIAKEMHVGHLRSTIIGEAVCRILEAAGNTVHRVNHVGDWGTQFGMLIQYLKEEYPDVHEGSELPNITDLTVFYKNAKTRFDEDPVFKKTSQTNVVALQSGDPDCVRIWKLLCDVSRREFQKVYDRLDVKSDEFGESFYNEKIPPVIEEFTKANKISVEEGGAKCVFVDKYKVPLMLQKSDGGYGYDSTDMAALKYRLFDLKADRIIVITDFTQADHFKMVYSAGRDIGWVTTQRLDHIGFGTVQGDDGKRFKTRSGDTVRLVDLLDEAVQRMETELRQRIADGKANITLDEVHQVAEAIGYGAVKYFDLRRNPTSNYKFSYDAMLDTKGDTAVYLLYTRVRLESIVAKAATEHNKKVEDLLKQSPGVIGITHPSERNLAFQLSCFADIMEQTLDDLYPYHICEYAYKLATVASDFVTQCRVLGPHPEMPSRVLLCHATTVALHQCFDLLGIRHVKRI